MNFDGETLEVACSVLSPWVKDKAEIEKIHDSVVKARRKFCSAVLAPQLLAASQMTNEDDRFFAFLSADFINEDFVKKRIVERIGDPAFLIRVGESMKRSTIAESADKRAALIIKLWCNTVQQSAPLCCVSDQGIADFINFTFGLDLTLETVRKMRQRLGLKKAKKIFWRSVFISSDGKTIFFEKGGRR